MSRIGKKPVEIPEKVKVSVADSGAISVEGPKGKLEWTLPGEIRASVSDGQVTFEPKASTKRASAMHGLSRALVSNMVTGVSTGFKKQLEINGVGFKAAVQGKVLNLSLGYSHPINFPIPDGVTVTVADNTKVTVEGIDRQKVGQVAADIRSYYPPEPYKGKGVKYSDETIIRKEGKTVQ